MQILEIKLHNFRSYQLFETRLGSNGTVIVGPNGTGKTNLLEAVYVLLRGNSFRTSLIDCINNQADTATILLTTDLETRRIQLQKSSQKLSKIFTVNDSQSKVLTKKHKLPVVLFEPNELRLISSSPTRRRDFLDTLLSNLDDSYSRQLRIFNRTLMQRNELLKRHQEDSNSWRDHLFAWDIKFVQSATLLATMRADFLYNHESELARLYSLLAGVPTEFRVEYLPSCPLDSYEQSLIDRLARSRDYEIATGHTSCGPHREDFTIYLHNQPAIKIASRGEMRTIMLAFKLLELDLQTKKSSTKPIILMDDVFSELDATREKLLQEVIEDHQFVVTTTDARQKVPNSLVISTD